MYFEHLRNALSPCKDLVESIFNFIQNHLNILWIPKKVTSEGCRLGFQKIFTAFIIYPTIDSNKVNDKTWNFTLEQTGIAKNHIDFMDACNIILGNN